MIFDGTSSFEPILKFLEGEPSRIKDFAKPTYKIEDSKMFISLPGFDNDTADIFVEDDFIKIELTKENNIFNISESFGIRIPESFKPFEVKLESFKNGVAVLSFILKKKESKKLMLS